MRRQLIFNPQYIIMDLLKRRAIAISDSSDSRGTTSLITHSFTTSKSSPPHFSPEDMGYPADICTHPIGKDHPMTRLWKPELRLKVMDRVKRRADEWQAVDVFRRGWSTTAELCEATVLITVIEATSDWTATICDVCLKHLNRKENEVKGLLARAANIVDGVLDPFFFVEWKATYACVPRSVRLSPD